MEKKMENEMEAGIIYRGYVIFIVTSKLPFAMIQSRGSHELLSHLLHHVLGQILLDVWLRQQVNIW